MRRTELQWWVPDLSFCLSLFIGINFIDTVILVLRACILTYSKNPLIRNHILRNHKLIFVISTLPQETWQAD